MYVFMYVCVYVCVCVCDEVGAILTALNYTPEPALRDSRAISELNYSFYRETCLKIVCGHDDLGKADNTFQ